MDLQERADRDEQELRRAFAPLLTLNDSLNFLDRAPNGRQNRFTGYVCDWLVTGAVSDNILHWIKVKFADEIRKAPTTEEAYLPAKKALRVRVHGLLNPTASRISGAALFMVQDIVGLVLSLIDWDECFTTLCEHTDLASTIARLQFEGRLERGEND